MAYFQGTINDKKLKDFNQYDNKLVKVKDRIEFVNNNLYEDEWLDEFFATYFNQYYNVSPNQDGALGEQDSVCKLLEILGTYILGANDVKSHRKLEYRFWKNEREYKDYKDSENLSVSTSSNDNGDEVEVIDMFVDRKNDNNQIKVGSTKVYKKDLKEIKEIKELEKAINYLDSKKGIKAIHTFCESRIHGDYIIEETELDRLIYIKNNTERFVEKYIKNLRENQVLIKEAIKKPLSISGQELKATDSLDFTDYSDVMVNKKLLAMLNKEDDLMSDMGLLVYDFKILVKRVSNFSGRELEIIELFKEGIKQKDMAEELNIDRRTVSDNVKRISEKIAKHYVKDLYNRTQKK